MPKREPPIHKREGNLQAFLSRGSVYHFVLCAAYEAHWKLTSRFWKYVTCMNCRRMMPKKRRGRDANPNKGYYNY